MFKAVYKNKNYYFGFGFHNITGNNVGIACLQILDKLIPLSHLQIFNYSGFNDSNNSKIFEREDVECMNLESRIGYIGKIIFEDGCYCIFIKKYLSTDRKSKFMYDIGQKPPMFEFNYVHIPFVKLRKIYNIEN